MRRRLKAAFIGGSVKSAIGVTHFASSRLDNHFIIEAGCFSCNENDNLESAQHYGVSPKRTYPNWKNLILAEKNSIEVIIILTPTPEHAEIVIECLKLGFAVICEKSLSVTSDECNRISECCSEYNGFLAVTFNYSGYPMIREIRELVSSNKIGKIHQIYVEMPQESFIKENCLPQKWRQKDNFIPTVSLDLGVHVHHLVDFITKGLEPLSLVANHATFGNVKEVVDNVCCISKFKDNVLVNAWWGKTLLGYDNGLRIRIFGENQSIEWIQNDPELIHCSDATGNRYTINRGSPNVTEACELRYNRFKVGHPAGFIEAFANLYSDIATCIHSWKKGKKIKTPYVYSDVEAIKGLKFLESISRSVKEKSWVNL